MTVQQISVFLENKPGKLAEFTKLLSENNIDIRALSVAEASDFGIVRMIVKDTFAATTALKDNNYICSITKVLAVEVKDEPGALSNMISVLGENDVNIEYMYALNTKKEGVAYMIIKVSDKQKAVEILDKNGMHIVCHDNLVD